MSVPLPPTSNTYQFCIGQRFSFAFLRKQQWVGQSRQWECSGKDINFKEKWVVKYYLLNPIEPQQRLSYMVSPLLSVFVD